MPKMKKLWYEDWEITTHVLSLGVTAKEFELPNSHAKKKFFILYGTNEKDSDIKELVGAFECALTELGKRKAPKKKEQHE